MSGATGPFQQRPNLVSPPLKGSFPLDHDQQCKLEMLKYMICLKEHKNQNEECRSKAKDYFQCRMDSGLMDKDDFPRLGFKEEKKDAVHDEKLKIGQIKK